MGTVNQCPLLCLRRAVSDLGFAGILGAIQKAPATSAAGVPYGKPKSGSAARFELGEVGN
jgi:hypothetical protein